jgi:hypothetical protein
MRVPFAAPAHSRFWHFSDMAARLADVRFRGQTGKHLLVVKPFRF